MVQSGSGYGVTNPSGLDPYPIESTLAQIAYRDNPVSAARALDSYWLQNQVDKSNYEYDLQQRHQAYKDQIAAQLQESYLKELPNLASHSGLLDVAAGMPGSWLAGNPALSKAIYGADTAAQAGNLEKLGKGTLDFSSAGVPIPQDSLRTMTNIPFVQGERPDITIERMKANAQMGAAALTAAAQKTGTISGQVPTGPGTEASVSIPFSPQDYPTARRRLQEAQGQGQTEAVNPPVPPTEAPQLPAVNKKSGFTQPPSTSAAGKALPAAPQSAVRITTAHPDYNALKAQADRQVQSWRDTGNPALARVPTNGQYQFIRTPDGSVRMLGNDGKPL